MRPRPLIPIETLDASARRTRFAITSRLARAGLDDPEDNGT